MSTLKEIKIGLSLINKEEAKMATTFISDITKDPTKKRQGKPPVYREKIFAWLVEAGLLENGYVRGYEIIEIAKAINLKAVTEKDIDTACKNVRKEIDVFVKLGLLNKYKNKYTIYKLDRLSNESDKEYKRRCKNTKYGVTTKVKWYICLTDKFYSECDRLGVTYDERFTISELNKFDKDGIEFSKLSKYTWSSYSFNYTERTTVTATGTVEVKTNANDIKRIIEERNENEDSSVYYEEPIVPITDEELEESSKEYLSDIEDEEISNNDEDYTIQPKQSTLDNVRNRKLNRKSLGGNAKCIIPEQKLQCEKEDKELPKDLSELEIDEIFVKVIGVTSEIGESIYDETKEQLGFNNNRNVTEEDYDNYFETALIAIAEGEIYPGNVSNIQYVQDIFNSIRHKLNYYN